MWRVIPVFWFHIHLAEFYILKSNINNKQTKRHKITKQGWSQTQYINTHETKNKIRFIFDHKMWELFHRDVYNVYWYIITFL